MTTWRKGVEPALRSQCVVCGGTITTVPGRTVTGSPSTSPSAVPSRNNITSSSGCWCGLASKPGSHSDVTTETAVAPVARLTRYWRRFPGPRWQIGCSSPYTTGTFVLLTLRRHHRLDRLYRHRRHGGQPGLAQWAAV